MIPTRPPGPFFVVSSFLFFTVLTGVFVFIPFFIVFFLFGTWDAAKIYAPPAALVFSVIFSLILSYDSYREAFSRFSHESKVAKAIGELKFNSGVTYCKDGVAFIVDASNSKALYVSDKEEGYLIIMPENIVEMVMEVDECVVSKSTSGVGGALAGAAIGGALFGGVGAIVGSISGKSQSSGSESQVRSVVIKLAVNNTKGSLIVLEFLNIKVGFNKGDRILNQIIGDANEFWAALSVLMSRKGVNASDSMANSLNG